jgi:glycosyltransferase involved in cell wall biosynthesis
MSEQPLVSVVTPFYNTAAFLQQCIESVLAQTYGNFEYLLVNNRSTDGSRDIAERYASHDARIRLIDNPRFVGQVENYNGALEQISAECRYVKVVQADDAILAECLKQMVSLAEREPRVGVVSSYYFWGAEIGGTGGVPWGVERLDGREACRRMFLRECFLVNTPTTVLYRADIVRSRRPFYALDRYFEDTDAAYEILLDHDLGFVHQILSFSRTDNDSISSGLWRFNPILLHWLIAIERHGRKVMSKEEHEKRSAEIRQAYLRYMGRALLRAANREFWDYHRRGLAQIERQLKWREVAPYAAREFAMLLLDPYCTARAVRASLRNRRMTRA